MESDKDKQEGVSGGDSVWTTPLLEDEEFQRIIQEFVGNLPTVFHNIQQGVIHSDWQTVRFYCHRLATASLFGYPEVEEKARELGTAARALDMDAAESALEKLSVAVEQTTDTAPVPPQ